MPGPTPVAVSDVAARRHLHEERFARGHPALAGARATPFEVHLESWRLASVASDAPEADTSAATAFWPLRLEAAATRFAIDLVLRGGKPIVRQGESGLSREGPNNASYYYSIPRIDAQGRLRVDGETHHVAGGAWLDREWSTSALVPEYAGWDWFALRLDDGRDLMLYRMRREDGQPSGYDSGALINAAGEARILRAEEFALTALEHWREWPIAWRLTLRGEPLRAPDQPLLRRRGWLVRQVRRRRLRSPAQCSREWGSETMTLERLSASISPPSPGCRVRRVVRH